jgi:hypothetical protein
MATLKDLGKALRVRYIIAASTGVLENGGKPALKTRGNRFRHLTFVFTNPRLTASMDD